MLLMLMLMVVSKLQLVAARAAAASYGNCWWRCRAPQKYCACTAGRMTSGFTITWCRQSSVRHSSSGGGEATPHQRQAVCNERAALFSADAMRLLPLAPAAIAVAHRLLVVNVARARQPGL